MEFARRRDFIVNRLNSIPGISCPEVRGAFYVMPNVGSFFGRRYEGRTISDSADLASLLIDEASVAVVPGTAFDTPSTVRMTYATSMGKIEEGLDRMENCLGRLS